MVIVVYPPIRFTAVVLSSSLLLAFRMPWYISPLRLGLCAVYGYFAKCQAGWIFEAEDRFRRSLTWKSTVGTIIEHKIVFNKFGASHIWYKYSVDGKEYIGDRFKSGGVNLEEHVNSPTLLGCGTELIVYYDETDPQQSAVKIQSDRAGEAFFVANIAICLAICYRSVRCETLLPNLFYRFLNVNRRMAEPTGMKKQRVHNSEKTKWGRHQTAVPATAPKKTRV